MLCRAFLDDVFKRNFFLSCHTDLRLVRFYFYLLLLLWLNLDLRLRVFLTSGQFELYFAHLGLHERHETRFLPELLHEHMVNVQAAIETVNSVKRRYPPFALVLTEHIVFHDGLLNHLVHVFRQ